MYILPVLYIPLFLVITQIAAQTEQGLQETTLRCVPVFAVGITSRISFLLDLNAQTLAVSRIEILGNKNTKLTSSALPLFSGGVSYKVHVMWYF